MNPSNYLQQIELLKFALRRATSSEVASNEDKFVAGREIARIKPELSYY